MKKVDVKILGTTKQYLNGHLDQPFKRKNNSVTEQ